MHASRIITPDRWLLGILAAAVALRAGAALYLGNQITEMPGIADQLSYHTLALRILDGHGFSFATAWWPATAANQPTAHWSYLYVLGLAGIYGIIGPLPLAARLIQAVLVGLLQPWLTYQITGRLFGRRAGLAATALVAGYSYFVYYAGALVTESLFMVGLLSSVHYALQVAAPDEHRRSGEWRPWIMLGLALASTVLLRQSAFLVVPVVLAWVAVSRWRADARGLQQTRVSLAAGMAAVLLVIGLSIVPWTIRNYLAFGEIVPLNTNAGFAFFWGNHPIHGSYFIPILRGAGGGYGALIPEELRGLNEAQLDKALLRRGLGFVADDPVRFVRLSLSRTVEYVRVWPSAESRTAVNYARLLSFGLCGPLFLAGILLSLRRRPAGNHLKSAPAGMWLLLAIAVTHSLVHLLTWTLVRYRLPVDALLMPFAAFAVVWAWDHFGSRDEVPAISAGGRSDPWRAAPPAGPFL